MADSSPPFTPVTGESPVTEVDDHLWLRDEDGGKYHATECWCWSDGRYGSELDALHGDGAVAAIAAAFDEGWFGDVADSESTSSAVAEQSSAYVRLPNGTTWPHPHDAAEVEWRLRYGTPTRSDLLAAASYIQAYRDLVWSTQQSRNRKISALRDYLRGGRPASSAQEREQ